MLRTPLDVLIKPLLLTLMALTLILFQESVTLFSIAVGLATILAARDLYRLVMRATKIRFSFTLAVSILLGYGLGSAIYLLANRTLDATEYQYWARYGLSFNQSGLSIALAVSLLAAAALYFRALFEKPINSHLFINSLRSHKSERIVFLGIAVAVLAFLNGDIGYMGGFVSTTGQASPLGAISSLMVPPLVPYTFSLLNKHRSLVKRAALIGAIVFFIGILFLLGRRYLLYSIVLSVLALRIHRYKFTKKALTGVAIFTILGTAILYSGFTFFMSLRLAVGILTVNENIIDLVKLALSQLGTEQANIVQSNLIQNLSSRPFILSYFAGLIGISHAPMFGADILYSIKLSVPSVLMPSKIGELPSSPEALSHTNYSLPIFDGPHSFLVAGYNDFGIAGAIFYPLIIAMFCYWFYRVLCTVVRTPSIRLFVIFALLFQLLFIEQSLAAVLVMFRNLILVVGLMLLIMKIPTLRKSTVRSTPPKI